MDGANENCGVASSTTCATTSLAHDCSQCHEFRLRIRQLEDSYHDLMLGRMFGEAQAIVTPPPTTPPVESAEALGEDELEQFKQALATQQRIAERWYQQLNEQRTATQDLPMEAYSQMKAENESQAGLIVELNHKIGELVNGGNAAQLESLASIDSLKSQLESSRQEMEHWKQQHERSMAEMEMVQRSMTDLTSEMQAQTEQESSLRTELANAKKMASELRSQLKTTAAEYEARIESLQSAECESHELLEEKLRAIQEQLTAAQQSLEAANADAANKSKLIVEFQKRFDLDQKNIRELKVEVQQSRQKLDGYEITCAQVKMLEHELNNVRQQSQSSQQLTVELEVAKTELQRAKIELEQMAANELMTGELTVQLHESRQLADKLRAERTDLTSTAQKLRTELEAVNKARHEAVAETEQLSNQLKQWQADYTKLEAAVAAHSDAQELQLTIANLNTRLAEAEEAFKDYQNNNEVEIQELRLKCRSLSQHTDDLVREVIMKAIAQAQNKQSQFNLQSQDIQSSAKELSDLRECFDAQQTSIKALQKDLFEAMDRLQQTSAENNRLEENVTELHSAVDALKEELSKEKLASESARTEWQRSAAELDSVRQLLQTTESQLKESTEKADSQKALIDRLHATAQELENAVAELRLSLVTKDGEVRSLDEELKNARCTVEQLMQAKNQLETAVSELKAAAAKSASLKIKAPSQLPQPAAGRTSITAPTLQPPIANRSVSLGTAASGQKEVGSKRTFSEAYTASNGGGAPAIPSSPLKHKTPRHSTAADASFITNESPAFQCSPLPATPFVSSAAATGSENRSANLPKQQVSKKFIISFSGFRGKDAEYSNELKAKLADMLRQLGADIQVDNEFQENITHVISPPNSRTLKTFAACLTSKWLITDYKWVIDSHEAGSFLPETKYGARYFAKPFKGRKFFLSKSFLNESQGDKAFRVPNAKNLIVTLGQGKIVEDVIEADFVLAGDRDTEKYAAPPVTWPAFIGMIPGNEQLMRK